MTDLVKNSTADHAIALLNHYSFDLEGYLAEKFVQQWADDYPSRWVRAAVIEALYQGRYKAVSVGQILAFWQRRGEPLCHFNYEFERIICSSSPQNLTTQSLPEIREPVATRRVEQPPTCLPSPLSTPCPPIDLPPLAAAEQSPVQEVPAGFGPEPQARDEGNPEQVRSQADPLVTPGPVSPPGPSLPPVVIATEANHNALPPELAEALSSSALENTPTESEATEAEQEIPLRVFQATYEDAPYEIYQANWSRSEAGKYPIHQFVPASATSEFHEKLKSVAQRVRG